MSEGNCLQHQKSIKIFQTQLRHTVSREKVSETGEKASKIKASQIFRATPKPWVAGSNPPAPAKNPARKCGIFTFSLLTLHFSLILQDFWQVRSNMWISHASVGVKRWGRVPIIPYAPIFPFATASKKQQPYQHSFKKVLGLPQILIVAVAFSRCEIQVFLL